MKTKTLKIPATMFRNGTFDRAAIDEEKRTVELSISSNAPYERWFGKEILDHSDGSIRMGRMINGAPLLFNHDRNLHLGRIIEAKSDGKALRVKAQFGNSALAQEKWKDVQDGILRETSVGYMVKRMVLEEEDEEKGDTYRVVDWEPMEGSLVTIPADGSVGVGRAAESSEIEIFIEGKNGIANPPQTSNNPATRKNRMAETSAATETETSKGLTVEVVAEREKKAREDGEASAMKKIGKIRSITAAWPAHIRLNKEVAALEAEAFEKNLSPEQYRELICDNIKGGTRVEEGATADLGLSRKEVKRYSLCRAILQSTTKQGVTGYEKELSDETAKILGKQPDGFFIPEDVQRMSLQESHEMDTNGMHRALEQSRTINALLTRNLLAGNFTSAGALIGVELLAGSLIELLRNKQLFANLGTTMLSGLQGNIAIPRQSGAATAYWLAEAASVTESDQQFQQVALSPKRLSAQTAYDKQLLAQASISVEAMVRNDIALVMALKKDLAILVGSGVSGEPLGILNTTGVQTVTFSGAPTWAKLVEFETDLATANADQTGVPVWLTNPTVRGKWKTTAQTGIGVTSVVPIFLWGQDNMINGYRGYVSNQVATTAIGAAPANAVYFGVPSEVIDAVWAGVDVVVNPYSLDSTGQIRTTVMQYTDIALRHSPSWIVSTDSGAQ